MDLGLTNADLRAGLTAIGELPIKAKEAANAVAIMDRYRAAIALLQAPPAEEAAKATATP